MAMTPKHRKFRVPKKVEKDSDIVGKTARLREVTRGERKKAIADFKKMKEKNLADSTRYGTSSSKAGMSNKKPKKPTSASPGSNIKKRSDTKNYNVGKSKGGVSFGEAFRHFKKKGAKAFTWNGKRYTTETK
tara:strand:+ start:344 stop:739 length:396 start_codon:yes stop_codon:yes gene_type:complete